MVTLHCLSCHTELRLLSISFDLSFHICLSLSFHLCMSVSFSASLSLYLPLSVSHYLALAQARALFHPLCLMWRSLLAATIHMLHLVQAGTLELNANKCCHTKWSVSCINIVGEFSLSFVAYPDCAVVVRCAVTGAAASNAVMRLCSSTSAACTGTSISHSLAICGVKSQQLAALQRVVQPLPTNHSSF